MSKPDHYPCFVVRFYPGCYYVIPIFVISNAKDFPKRLPKICRLVILKPEPGEDLESVREDLLLQSVISESNYLQRENCLVLNENLCYFFNPSSEEFRKTTEIPQSSLWMPDSFFLNSTVGTPDKRDRLHTECVSMRIYSNKLSEVDGEVLRKVHDKGFSPQIIVFKVADFRPFPELKPEANWLQRLIFKLRS